MMLTNFRPLYIIRLGVLSLQTAIHALAEWLPLLWGGPTS